MKRNFEVKFKLEIESETIDKAKESIKEAMLVKNIKEFEVKQISDKRTINQNNALHLWFERLAGALNEAGWDIRKTIKGGIDIPWVKESIKEYLWRPVMRTFLTKESTIELDKIKDIDACYDIINRTIAERTGVSIPFPSIENLEEDKK